MKKLFTLLILMLLWAGSSFGQSAIIGTGTLTTNGSSADPVERYYNYEHFQIVYTAAELTAAGMPAGVSITALGFSISESAVSLANFTIDMGLTALEIPPVTTGLINVKTAFTYAPVVQAAGSFDMITFDVPFLWDGTSNIVINTCTGSNPFTSPYGGLRYTASTTYMTKYLRTDGSSNCATTVASTTLNRPNIQFYYTGGSACSGTPAPGLTVSSANPVCPSVSFTLTVANPPSGSGVTYQWQSSPDGADPWTDLGTTSSYSTSQTTATWYRCHVTCSGNTGTSTPLHITMNPFSDCYCLSSATSASDEEILNVTVGSLNNTSTCATLAPGPGSIQNMYSNYKTSVTPPDLGQTFSIPFSVQVGTCGGSYSNGIKIFIDFNQNGLFTDPGEEVYVSAAATAGPHFETGNILIPADATLDVTVMRVVCVETGTPSSITPCGTYSWGETEDYLVKIVAPTVPALSATPTSLAFGYVPSGGTSIEHSYMLSGINLTDGPVVVTAPAGFGVSLASGGPYLTSVNVPYAPPTLAATPIYVQFAPTGPGAVYSGTITNVGGGASTNVTVSGSSDVFSLYCASSASFTGDEEITKVQFGSTLNNISACGSLVGSQGTATGTADLYSNFTSIAPTDVMQGGAIPISVEISLCNGYAYGHLVKVYIDFNQNGLLTDPGEETIIWTYASSLTHTINSTISIPISASLGNTLMRVVCKETSAFGPCDIGSYGETEDYKINITPVSLGTLQGVVTDCFTTNPLVGATVSTGSLSATTDGSGFYSLSLPSGTHDVTFSYPGFVSSTETGVVVSTGSTTTLDKCLNEYLAPPVGLQAVVYLQDVNLTWMAPGAIADQWIKWDDGTNGNSIGVGGAAVFDVASRWPVSDIGPYNGMYLKKVRFFPAEVACTYTIEVWKGVNASTLLYSQVVTSPVIGAFNEVTLTTPVPIDGSDEFWFGYNVNTTAGYPAGCDLGPQIAGKGNMIYWTDGWYLLTDLNAALTYNWNIAGFVSSSSTPGIQTLMPMVQNTTPKSVKNEGTLQTSIPIMGTGASPVRITAREDIIPQNTLMSTPTGYNVYRDATEIATNIAGLTYNDLGVDAGDYYYTVKAVYPQGLSVASNSAHAVVLSCQPPADIKILSTGTGQVSFSWQQGMATPPSWIVEYGPVGFTPETGAGTVVPVVTNPTVTLTVTPGVLYDFYVRSNCGEGDLSPWLGPKTFRSHYFDCPVGSTAELEVCSDTTNNGCNLVIPSFENIALGQTICGTSFFNGSNRDTDWYTFTLAQQTDVTLTGSADFDLVVGFILGGCPATSFISYQTALAGATASLTTTLAAGTYTAFAAPQFTGIFACDEADRYKITLTGNTCIMPVAAVPAAINITGSSADIQWTAVGTETEWEYVIGLAPLPLPTGAGIATTVNPTFVDGLSGSSTYNFYVRAKCGVDSYSGWAGPFTFTTLCNILVAPFTQQFTTWPPTCWDLTGGTYSWVHYNTTAVQCARANFWSQTSGNTDIMTTPTIDVSGLATPGLKFDWSHYYMSSYPTDALEVLVSDDNGSTWTQVWYKTGTALNSNDGAGTTVPGTFVSSGDIDLSAFGDLILIKFLGNSGYGPDVFVDNVQVYQPKVLSVKVLLEGLYNGAGGMNQAYDEFGPHFAAGIADQVTLELRNSVTGAVEYTMSNLNLGTDGMISAIVPSVHNGLYFIYVHHRNSITTSTANPVSFAGPTVSYDFSTGVSQAFGENEKDISGVAVIYAGDVNQDCGIDSGDMIPVDNDNAVFAVGYLATDVDGSGGIDSGDMIIVDNNNAAFVGCILPF